MGATTLAAFCQAFPNIAMHVRDPDLDDLFLTMSREGA